MQIRTVWRFLKKLKIELEHDQQSSAGHLPKDLESGSGGDVVPRVHRGTVHGSRGAATALMSVAASGPRKHGMHTRWDAEGNAAVCDDG